MIPSPRRFLAGILGALSFALVPHGTHAYSISGNTVTLAASDRTSDNTTLIQGFLNNPTYTKIIIPPGSGNASWPIGPLTFAHNNTEIQLNANTVLEALSYTAFPTQDTCLLTADSRTNIKITGQSGATLLLHVEDYETYDHDPDPGELSEHRHAINLLGSSQVTIDGITIINAPGDGIYLGSAGSDVTFTTYCSNVTINNVVIDGAARNGIGVISVEGLDVTNSTIKNTMKSGNVGTEGPWAGIDLEPNYPTQRLRDIEIYNCALLGNAGFGILQDTGKMPGSTETIQVTVSNCLLQGSPYIGGESGFGVKIASVLSTFNSNSRTHFHNCAITDNQQEGIYVTSKAHDAGLVTFANCFLQNNNTVTGYIPIYANGDTTVAGGNFQFNNVVIEQSPDLNASHKTTCLMVNGNPPPNATISDVSGTVYASEGAVIASNATVSISKTSNVPTSLWKLDATSGTTVADSAGSNTGTLRNSPTWAVGQSGGGLQLNGSTHYAEITTGSSNLNIGTGDFTVALWFQRSANTTANKRLLYKGASSNSETGYAISGSDTTLEFLLSNGTTRLSVAGTIPALNRWTHAACVLSRNGNMTLYINGVYQNATSISSMSGANITNAINLLIGAAASGSLSWPGMVDDVRIYKRELPPGEVLALSRAPSAHWRLNETSGSTVSESAGRSSATSVNSPTWTSSGRIANALNLNGSNQYVQVTSNSGDLNIGTGDFSVSLWFQRASSITSNARLLYKGASSNSDTGYAIAGSNTTLEFLLCNGSTRLSVAGSIPALNQWTHAVCSVSRSGNMTLYIDGVFQQSTSVSSMSAANITNAINLLIGAASGGYNWPGKVDDVRLYKRALSADEALLLAGQAAVN